MYDKSSPVANEILLFDTYYPVARTLYPYINIDKPRESDASNEKRSTCTLSKGYLIFFASLWIFLRDIKGRNGAPWNIFTLSPRTPLCRKLFFSPSTIPPLFCNYFPPPRGPSPPRFPIHDYAALAINAFHLPRLSRHGAPLRGPRPAYGINQTATLNGRRGNRRGSGSNF